MHEDKDVNVRELGMIEDIGRDKVEIGRVECKFGVKLFAHITKVAQLVNKSGTIVVALEPSCEVCEE